MTPREIGRISDAVFNKDSFANGDDPIQSEAISRIIGELTSRAAKYWISLPHEKVVSEAETCALWTACTAKYDL